MKNFIKYFILVSVVSLILIGGVNYLLLSRVFNDTSLYIGAGIVGLILISFVGKLTESNYNDGIINKHNF